MDAPDLPRTVETELSQNPMRNHSIELVKVVEWKSESPWISDDAEPLAFLLTKYGRYTGSADYHDFSVSTITPTSPSNAPGYSMNNWNPLTINYDGGIALQGLALGHDPEQLSHLDNCSTWNRNARCGAILQWRTEPGLDTDLVISLRLYNA